MDIKKMIFIDESRIDLGMNKDYGRASKGERVYDSKLVHAGGGQTIVGVLGLDGLRTSMITEDTVNGDLVLSFVEKFLVFTLKAGDIVILDNYRIHWVEGVEEAIEEVGAHFLLLPPYSPDLSRIEEFWFKIKK